MNKKFSGLMDINCNALSKLFAYFCNMSLPALGDESLKPCCCCSMKSFLRKITVLKLSFLVGSKAEPFFHDKDPRIRNTGNYTWAKHSEVPSLLCGAAVTVPANSRGH